MTRKLLSYAFLCGALLLASSALAAQPLEWQMGFQTPASPLMGKINEFHDFLLLIIAAIAVFVASLMGYVLVRFRAKRSRAPSRVSHNTPLEVAWTVVPALILVMIAVPSFRLLYEAEALPEPEVTIRATGYQWYWNYAYPEHGGFSFDSYMVADDELSPGQLRLLSTDNYVAVPTGRTVRVLVAADPDGVIHSWAVPSLGVKMDAVPGRLNEVWFKIDEPGTYYGQCSELCGQGHGFMPIEIRALPEQAFAEWVASAISKFGIDDDGDDESEEEE